jgi:hypothetical protein
LNEGQVGILWEKKMKRIGKVRRMRMSMMILPLPFNCFDSIYKEKLNG